MNAIIYMQSAGNRYASINVTCTITFPSSARSQPPTKVAAAMRVDENAFAVIERV